MINEVTKSPTTAEVKTVFTIQMELTGIHRIKKGLRSGKKVKIGKKVVGIHTTRLPCKRRN